MTVKKAAVSDNTKTEDVNSVVKMEATGMDVSESTITIGVKITNKLSKSFKYGLNFYVERFYNGCWEKISTTTPSVIPSVISIIPSNHTTTTKYVLKDVMGEISPGKYRLVIPKESIYTNAGNDREGVGVKFPVETGDDGSGPPV